MHAVTLTIMLVSVTAAPAEYDAGVQPAQPLAAEQEYQGEGYVDETCEECGDDCESCGCGHRGRGGHAGGWSAKCHDWWGAMPQTCYAPRFGCYPGNNRHMHRYPAFHGVYYRRPYNYRNLFDYPWHAELREPTSQFSYETPEEERYDDDAPLPEADAASVMRRVPAKATSLQRRPTPNDGPRVSRIAARHCPGRLR